MHAIYLSPAAECRTHTRGIPVSNYISVYHFLHVASVDSAAYCYIDISIHWSTDASYPLFRPFPPRLAILSCQLNYLHMQDYMCFIKQTTFNMIAIPAKRWHVKREARVLSKAHFSLHSVQPYDIALIIYA